MPSPAGAGKRLTGRCSGSLQFRARMRPSSPRWRVRGLGETTLHALRDQLSQVNWTNLLDNFQSGLDAAGLVPAVGNLADILNGVISLGRGRVLDAGVRFTQALPGIGQGVVATRLANTAVGITAKVRKALPVTKQGGRYGDLITDSAHRHHMPAKQASPLSEADGPAIRMSPEDHRKTASYGGRKGSTQQAYRDKQAELIKQGRFDDAFMMDVDDIQSKFGNKYDNAILEAMDALP